MCLLSHFILFILFSFFFLFFSLSFSAGQQVRQRGENWLCLFRVRRAAYRLEFIGLDYIMVSMVDHTDMAMDSIVPKHEPGPDGSISSTVSTPDPEAEPLTQDAAQTQKRKGGRKPVRNIFSNLGPRNSFVSLVLCRYLSQGCIVY